MAPLRGRRRSTSASAAWPSPPHSSSPTVEHRPPLPSDRARHRRRAPRHHRRPHPSPDRPLPHGRVRRRDRRIDLTGMAMTRPCRSLPHRRAPTSAESPGAVQPGRVAEVHVQARRGLLVAAGFVMAAVIAAITRVGAGWSLPMHLFVVGGLLSAISAATQMLAVSSSAAPAPRPHAAVAQRWALAAGAVTLVVGPDRPDVAVHRGGTTVVAAMLGLATSSRRSRAAGRDRTRPPRRRSRPRRTPTNRRRPAGSRATRSHVPFRSSWRCWPSRSR